MTACDACPDCHDLAADHAATGRILICDACGTVHAPEDWTWPRQALAAPPGSPPWPLQLLAPTLAELALAARWGALVRGRVTGGPAVPRSPLGRWIGAASGADPSSEDHVRSLARILMMPETRGGRSGRRIRADFVAALVRYCEETSRPLDEPDWPAARAAAERLRTLAVTRTLEAAVLCALADAATPRTAWAQAAGIAADAVAPPGLRARWERLYHTRPSADDAAASDDDRLVWGSHALGAALRAWADGTTSR